eukprot:CAMPEP_0168525588 /NCGR_PEP_ID=MMETSP0405-20121227/11400_1 /TAXON_ID=498012 /ORGANISM="Trichosphaerium sp, Strain Am-I-7 wt" /LENGTH=198 /DNA_ID=CAMNT_0008548145 /DNA_START=1025 /DNA_END=1618 /DNA_ORIENTATION=-
MWEEQTREIFDRSLKQVGTSKDMPRLAKHFVIYDEDQKVVPMDFSGNNQEITVNLFATLFVCVERVYRNTKDVDKKLKPLISTLRRLFEIKNVSEGLDVVFDVLEPKSGISPVLKCFNQNITAPATKELFKKMAKTCPFLDGKHWQVHVSLLKTGLEIKHVKNQRHVAQEFEFEWQLVLTFDLELTSLTKMYLNIIDW